jgi:hypothetical protein
VFRKSWLGKSEWAEIPSGSYLSKYFSGKRIHGSADVRLLYLHLNISGLRRDSTEFQKVRADVEKVNPKPLVRKDTKLRLARFGDYQIAKGFEQIVYKVSVIQKLPSNIQNLKDGFGVLHSESTAPAEVDTESVALGNVQQIKIAHIPSDVTVTGFAGQVGDQKELEKQTFSNEGKHWWDVGFTLPVREFRAIDYDRESGTITGKEVTRQNLFGTFNLYLPPVDTERTIFRWLPHLLYGLPIQGKVLQRHLVGLGIGLNKAEVFAGVTFDQTRRPLAGSANALETRWIRRFTFGVNIPVRSAINALKPAKDKK